MPDTWLVNAAIALLVILGFMSLAKSSKLPRSQRGKTIIMRQERRGDWGFYTQILLSLVLLAVGLYVILSKQYAAADTNWSFGIVGAIIGYWLKGR